MEHASSPFISRPTAFRLFLARITAGWLFLVFVILWLTKGLPYHFPDRLPDFVINPEIAFTFSLVWVIVSTILLFFLIVPARLPAMILVVCMTVFIQCYRYEGVSLVNPAFVWVFIPFILPHNWFKKGWQVLKWILLISLAFHSWYLPLSWKALPGYTLYFIPFIPWERMFVSFIDRFEPK